MEIFYYRCVRGTSTAPADDRNVIRDELRTGMYGIRDELRGEIQLLGVALHQEIRTAQEEPQRFMRIPRPPSRSDSGLRVARLLGHQDKGGLL
jgi:hypothetical protein